MKTKAIILLVICVFLVIDFSMAQLKGADSGKKAGFTASTGTSASSPGITAGTALQLSGTALEGEEGNLFVGDKWPPGKLELKDGRTIESYRYRYDIYGDQMQFISDNDTLAFAAPAEMKSVTFEGKTFIYSPYEYSGTFMKGYFELLVTGKKQLLLKRTVTYHLQEEAKEGDKPTDTYLVSETFYLKNGNNPAQKVLCNRKCALDALNDRKKEVEEFLKKSGNKVKTPEELVKVVEYYDSLNQVLLF